MRRAVLSLLCSCFLASAGRAFCTHLQHHDRLLQEDDGQPCAGTWELSVAAGGSSGPSEVTSALAEAGACAAAAGDSNDTAAVVSVRWAGSFQTPEPFLVPGGVELRVAGDGWFSSYVDSSDGNDDVMTLDAELAEALSDAADAAMEAEEPSVIGSSSGNTSLFVVEAGGSLSLSRITLSGAWGGADGGGAVYSSGGQVNGEDVRWESLSAEGAGGAIFANQHSNVTFSGLHLFQGCSSSTQGGGALFVQNSSVSLQDGAQVYFEGCTAADDGGGLELSSSAALTLSSDTRTRFRGCGAVDKGGGLYMKLSAVDVAAAASLEFRECAAGDISGAKGGGVCSFESSFSVDAGGSVIFSNNSSPVGDGGGFYGQATPLRVAAGGALRFAENRCEDSGGGLALEWLAADNDTACLDLADGSAAAFDGNGAAEYGGGAYVAGCQVSASGSDISFTGNTAERAGALYIDEAGVRLAGGMASFVGNSADRWGGAVFLLDSRTTTGGGLEISGGLEFTGNVAGRSGGAIYIENGDLSISGNAEHGEEGEGGTWVGNTAGYDGGVVAVDGGGVYIAGGFASSNHAAQRGGVLFGTGESTVVWEAGGESFNNSAAAGGSLYLSSSAVNLTDLSLAGDRTPSGPNVFLAAADVRAVNVTLTAPAELDATFALHVDSGSTLRAFGCRFDLWDGDASGVVSEGSVVMDACDFGGSGTPTLVHASGKAATVRNAILGDKNFDRAGFNASSLLGVGVAGCASLPAGLGCTLPEECVDAENGMGVLCPAFVDAATGGVFALTAAAGAPSSTSAAAAPAVELSVVAPESSSQTSEAQNDADVFYYPDVVTREVVLSYPDTTEGQQEQIGSGGGVGALWELRRTDGDGDGEVGDADSLGRAADGDGTFPGMSLDNFTWTAVPLSGFLVRGQEVTIRLEATPPPPEDPLRPFAVYNGEVSAEFQVVWRTAEADSTVASAAAAVGSMFYYCQDGSYWDGESCVSCAEEMATMVDGAGALECNVPGVTLDTLPLATGYWRGDITRTFVRECLNPSACIGGRGTDTTSSAGASSDSVISAAVTTTTTSSTTPAKAPADFYDETRYCVEGHKGAYCAVCAAGYRRISRGQLCVSCDGGWSGGARATVWVLGVVAPVLLGVLVVFLVGGVAAVAQIKHKLTGGSKTVTATTPGGGSVEMSTARSAKRATVGDFWARLVRAVPFQKLKILIVVWQILTQFSHLAEVPYPPTYQRFLNTLDAFNFDITWPLNATCIVGNISFYKRLVGVTLGPLVVLAFLGTTYAVAMRVHRGGRGRESSEARQRAVVRHASAALLVLFLVFSSVSTTVFSTYACDYVEDLDVSLLRADYSISCDTPDHLFYKDFVRPRSGQFLSAGTALDIEEVLESRAHNPDLQSTRFLWEPYEPDNYYYETVECGRRCLLTGALVFVLPNTAGQAAGACIFAFLSLLAFELLRPHLSRTDAWMYRMGCIVVFFSNFLALMAKADVSDEKAQSQETFGLLLIAVHASMVIAVIAQAYVSMQATSESRDDYLESMLKKNARGDPKVSDGSGDGGGGLGGNAGLPGFDAYDGERGERAADHAVMLVADTVEEQKSNGGSSGWEDVERRKRSWGRRSKNSLEDDGNNIEDSIELESVYSRRGKKTSLIAGSVGLPSSIVRKRSSGAAGRTHGRAHSVSSSRESALSGYSAASTLPSFTLSPRTGHVLRHSSGGGGVGGFGFGGGGDDGGGGRRQNRRPGGGPGSAMSLSSSLSPIRQVRHGRSSGADAGGVHPFRVIGARAVSDRRLDLATASSSMPESLVDGNRGGAEGDEDTTAAKLERLHSLSAAFDAAPGGPPTLAATARFNSEGHAARRARPRRQDRNTAGAGQLDPPPLAPTLAANATSVREDAAARQLQQQQQRRRKKPHAGEASEISPPPRLRRGGESRRRPRGNDDGEGNVDSGITFA
eukprot:g7664.t1